MYLALDIGGSKTLLAVFSEDGKLVESQKIPTDPSYNQFLKDLGQIFATSLKAHAFTACCCAIPGRVDRNNGVGVVFGNLPWKNVPIRDDLKKMLGGIPVLVENDSNLAGLSEALIVHNEYKKVLYITISTGIGDGIIIDGIIDPSFADSESGQMVLLHEGKLQKWEDFASGRALVAKYGKKASEINDPKIWQEFVPGVAAGLDELIATLQPEVVIIGGGVGAHFEKFGEYLREELKKYENPMVRIPPIIKAKRPEEAVIYGCYEFTRQSLDKNK
ncbi:MAG: ROK family protein [Candidatus Saccharimonadales bacterium]